MPRTLTNQCTAPQTKHNVLQFFGIRASKQDAVPAAAGDAGHGIKHVEVFLEYSIAIEVRVHCTRDVPSIL